MLSLVLFASCAHGPGGSAANSSSGEVIPLAGTFQVHRYSLPNGLKLLIVEDHSSPTIAYQTWFSVGSRDEVPQYTGLAHLFEHMMFKGTKNHPEGEYDRILEHAGGEGINAFTSHDHTTYVQEVPKEELALVASLESDRMVNLVVDEQSFRTELQVVQNERRYRNENNPDGFIEQALFDTAFTRHPYHWPVIGYQEDLDRMSVDDARRFYQTNYNPAHATIIIVGDVVPADALKVIQDFYGKIPAVWTPTHIIEQDPPQKHEMRKKLALNIQVQKLVMAFKSPPAVSQWSPALEMLATVLSSGESSRLQRALVETGIASGIDANNGGEHDQSLFTIDVNLQKGKTAAEAEAAIKRELERIKNEPISQKELERARNRTSFDFYNGLATNGAKARFLGESETVMGSFEKGIDLRKKQLTVEPAEIQAAAKAIFVTSNETVIVATPKGAKK